MSCSHMIADRCALELYGGAPSPGVCAICDRNTSEIPRVELSARAIASAVVALTVSAVLPPCSDAEQARRVAACMECPARWPGDATRTDSVGWCKECGCGTGGLAALSRKVAMRSARCPRGTWALRDTITQ